MRQSAASHSTMGIGDHSFRASSHQGSPSTRRPNVTRSGTSAAGRTSASATGSTSKAGFRPSSTSRMLLVAVGAVLAVLTLQYCTPFAAAAPATHSMPGPVTVGDCEISCASVSSACLHVVVRSPIPTITSAAYSPSA